MLGLALEIAKSTILAHLVRVLSLVLQDQERGELGQIVLHRHTSPLRSRLLQTIVDRGIHIGLHSRNAR